MALEIQICNFKTMVATDNDFAEYSTNLVLCAGKPNNGTSPTASANASPVTGRSGKEHNDNLGKD